jgi:hypothetical protein
MLKAPMLLAAVLVVCVASSADARRRHHHGYYGYGERSPSSLDDWRRARATQPSAQDPQQGREQNPQQDRGQDPQQARDQDPAQDRAQDSGQARGQTRGEDRAQNQNSGQDRARSSYDRRRAGYDDWRRARYERRARYVDWRRARERDDWRRSGEREDWTRRREAERGDAALRRTRGGPFAAVVEKLVRGCGRQGAEFDNWPFDAIAQTVGADEKERTALEGLRESANKAAERLAADCPQEVPTALSTRLEAVEQGIDATLAAFDTVEPALQSFYGALDDEQKARLYRDMMAAPAAADGRETAPRRDAQDERRARREYSSRRERWRAYAAAREAAAREPTPNQARSQARTQAAARDTSGPAWSAMCEELAGVLRGWPVREIERDVRLSSAQRVAFYELVTASLKAADTLGSACPAESALTPVGRMDAMRTRLAAVRAATAAIRPALTHFYEALDQGQKMRFAGMS